MKLSTVAGVIDTRVVSVAEAALADVRAFVAGAVEQP